MITRAFGWIGLPAPNFLGSTQGAWCAVTLLTLRWSFGCNFILYTAAVQEISEDQYQAAAIDGAGPWQQIKSITVSLLKPTISLVLILQMLGSLKVFDQTYLLLSGGPAGSTRPAIEYIHDTGSTSYRAAMQLPRRWSVSSSWWWCRRLRTQSARTKPETVPVGLGGFIGGTAIQHTETMASSVLGIAPLIAVVLLLQRQIVQVVSNTGIK